METSLEEFLEELDALVGPEEELSPKLRAESKEEDVGKDLPPHTGTVGADEAGSDEADDGDDPEGGGAPPESSCDHGAHNTAVDTASGSPAASQGEKAPKPRIVPEKKVRFSEETVKETKGPEEVAPIPIPSEPEVTGAIKGSSRDGQSLSVVTEEAKGEGTQKRDQEVSDLPHNSAPASGVLVDSHADEQGPRDTSKTETVEKKRNDTQGLTPEPETGKRPTDGDSAALPEESAHQPLKHSKNARSPGTCTVLL